MYGWIRESLKALIVSKFGGEIWEKILEKAKVESEEWLMSLGDFHADSETTTYDLVTVASEVLGYELSHFEDVYGMFFIHFVKSAGYVNLLECLGGDLRSWLSNLQYLRDHIRIALPYIRVPNIQ
jgi:hypothetical protein